MGETTFEYMKRRDPELRRALQKNGKAAPEDFSYDETIKTSDAIELANKQPQALIDDNKNSIIEEAKKQPQAVGKEDNVSKIEVVTIDDSATQQNKEQQTRGGDSNEKDNEER